MSSEISIIFNAIKNRLKNQKMTYAELATKMETTEAAIKNIFHSKSISLDRLLVLCHEMGMSLGELLQVSGLGLGGDFELSDEAEKFFVSHPEHYTFFREFVVHRKSLSKIARENNLDEKSLKLYLAPLAKLKIISISPQDSVHVLLRGRHRWRVGGAWFQKNYLDTVVGQVKSFLRSPTDKKHFVSFGAFSLSPEDLQSFRKDLENLVDSYQAIALEKSLALSDAERLKEIFVGFNLMVTTGEHPTSHEKIQRLK